MNKPDARTQTDSVVANDLVVAGALLALLAVGAAAPVIAATADGSIAEAYQRARQLAPENKGKLISNADLRYHWMSQQDQFWYQRSFPDGTRQFIMVDAASGTRHPAFPHDTVAAALSKATGDQITGGALPFDEFELVENRNGIRFTYKDHVWTCRLSASVCAPAPRLEVTELISPNGKWVAFVKDHNLWVRSTQTGQERALSQDGIEYFAYAGVTGDTTFAITNLRSGVKQVPTVVWSPDSSRLVTQKIDERAVKDLRLIEAVPPDRDSRPRSYSYRYAIPGDNELPTSSIVVFDVASGTHVDLATPPLDPRYKDPITGGNVWWSQDGKSVYCLHHDRYFKTYSLYIADAVSGHARRILTDTSATNYNINWLFFKPMVRSLSNGDIIWYSERSGWGQLYYYNADGTPRNPITSGSWVVFSIVFVDEEHRKVYLTGGGREQGRQPYDRYLYSVNLDGTGLKLLTPEDADHLQPGGRNDPPAGRAAFSASGRYFIDSYSRPDLEPHLLVRSANGGNRTDVETADISRFKASGYSMPEPFAVSAADGRTPLYGTLFKPSHFDPAKRYPVIDSIYPGPQSVMNSRRFTDLFQYERQALAELGFIVVTLDGRGGPYRSKEFWDQSYGKLSSAGMLDDHIAGLRELAQSRTYMDLNRVGITGWSGGGYASTHAILAYPDFYRVAVSISGDHDQAHYLSLWGDLYNGPDLSGYPGTRNASLAAGLKGKLLLVHGEMDDNVPPSQTMDLVDALMRQNKDFDMLYVPGANHSLAVPGKGKEAKIMSSYVQRRRWDYFVRNLLGVEPPQEFSLYPSE